MFPIQTLLFQKRLTQIRDFYFKNPGHTDQKRPRETEAKTTMFQTNQEDRQFFSAFFFCMYLFCDTGRGAIYNHQKIIYIGPFRISLQCPRKIASFHSCVYPFEVYFHSASSASSSATTSTTTHHFLTIWQVDDIQP